MQITTTTFVFTVGMASTAAMLRNQTYVMMSLYKNILLKKGVGSFLGDHVTYISFQMFQLMAVGERIEDKREFESTFKNGIF